MLFCPLLFTFISIELIIGSISPTRSICMIVVESIVTVLYNCATIPIRCTHVKAALHTIPMQKRQRSVIIRSYLANRRSSRVLIPSPTKPTSTFLASRRWDLFVVSDLVKSVASILHLCDKLD